MDWFAKYLSSDETKRLLEAARRSTQRAQLELPPNAAASGRAIQSDVTSSFARSAGPQIISVRSLPERYWIGASLPDYTRYIEDSRRITSLGSVHNDI